MISASDADLKPSGYFRWNKAGWFGGQFGFSAWLAAGGVMLIPKAPGIAALWLAGFVVLNTVGIMLWRRRDRLRAYTATQLLVLMFGIVGIVATLTLDTLRPDVELVSAPHAFHWGGILYLTAVIMTVFALRERASRRRTESPNKTESVAVKQRPGH
jgi:heme A synthase